MGPQIDVARALPAYDIGEELGRGGWGTVTAGVHRQLGRPVAIKQLHAAFGADPDVRERFQSEARLLASFDHPHIVPVYDYVEADGMCLLVMERLGGGSVWEHYVANGPDVRTTCAIGLAVASALEYAHANGVLHRDIKPDNLMCTELGNLKVTDFGIAKVLGGGDQRLTRTGHVIGTPEYMAPEHVESLDLGPGCDIYALGIVLYEMLAGTLPFEPKSSPLAVIYSHVHDTPIDLAAAAPYVPRPVSDVIMHTLAPDPSDRPSTADAFAAELRAAGTEVWGPDWVRETRLAIVEDDPLLSSARHPAIGRPSRTTVVEREASARDTTPANESLPPPLAPGSHGPDGDGRGGGGRDGRVPKRWWSRRPVAAIAALVVVATIVTAVAAWSRSGDQAGATVKPLQFATAIFPTYSVARTWRLSPHHPGRLDATLKVTSTSTRALPANAHLDEVIPKVLAPSASKVHAGGATVVQRDPVLRFPLAGLAPSSARTFTYRVSLSIHGASEATLASWAGAQKKAQATWDAQHGEVGRSITGLAVFPTALTLQIGQSWPIAVAATLDDGSRAGAQQLGDLTWSPASPAVATVDATGTVHALAVGHTTVSVRVGGHGATVDVTVTPVAPGGATASGGSTAGRTGSGGGTSTGTNATIPTTAVPAPTPTLVEIDPVPGANCDGVTQDHQDGFGPAIHCSGSIGIPFDYHQLFTGRMSDGSVAPASIVQAAIGNWATGDANTATAVQQGNECVITLHQASTTFVKATYAGGGALRSITIAVASD